YGLGRRDVLEQGSGPLQTAAAEVDLGIDQGLLLLGVIGGDIPGGVRVHRRAVGALDRRRAAGASGIPADDVEPLEALHLEVTDVLGTGTPGTARVDEQGPGRRPRTGR